MTEKAKEAQEKPYHGSWQSRVEVVMEAMVVVVGSTCERVGGRSVGLRRRSDIDIRALGLWINLRQRDKREQTLGGCAIVGVELE